MSARIRWAAVLICGLATVGFSGASSAGNTKGIGGAIPAYYDHIIHTINLTQLPSGSTLLEKNGQQNNIWFSSATLPGGGSFIAVIDAIPTDGMNPLWAGNVITFTAGTTPFQIFSDNGVTDALNAGQITVTPMNVMFRCAIIGAPIANIRPAALEPAASAPHNSTWGRLKQIYR